MQDRAERTLISLDGQWTLYYATETGGKNQDYRPGMENTWPAINASVPGNSELALMQAGAAISPEDISLSPEECLTGLRWHPYMRSRITLMRLFPMLGIPVDFRLCLTSACS